MRGNRVCSKRCAAKKSSSSRRTSSPMSRIGSRRETNRLASIRASSRDQPTRFDTRFFVARAPTEQIALHDGHETVHSEWLGPELALERFAAGELNLISPTENNLKALVGFSTTEDLLAAKRNVDPRSIPTIIPRLRRRNGTEFEEVLETVSYGGQSSCD